MNKISVLITFVAVNYPEMTQNIMNNLGRDTMDELIEDFHMYLLNLGESIYNKLEIDMLKIVSNINNPLRMNGWHPALRLHFDQYIKEALAKEEEKDMAS